jgi:hypothetical protein
MVRSQLRSHMSLILILLLLLAAPISAVAQGEQPPRVADREAPEREATVRPLSEDALLAQVVLHPVADAYIASERPDQNFGTSGLFLGYNLTGDHFGAQRILLRFNVEGALPAGAVINDARLRLYLNYASPLNDAPMPNRLQRVDEAWGEQTVTWNSEPRWGPTYVTTTVGSASGWYEWEITDLVRQWVGGSVDNHGVEIIGDETIQQRERAFYARETSTAFAPQLLIDFTDISDLDPPDITVDPLPEYVPRDFTVTWSGDDPGPAEIAHYDVQFRVDGGDWIDWLSRVTFTEAVFVGEDGRIYEFRARGVDEAGNVQPFGDVQASTTVDNAPPVSSIEPLPPITSATSFVVSWSATDEGSGVATFDVNYRFNHGPWIRWLLSTTVLSATFDATLTPFAEIDGVYEFEVRATDNVGNVEAFRSVPDAFVVVDSEPPFIVPQQRLPLILSNQTPGP